MTDYLEWVPVAEYNAAQKKIMKTKKFEEHLEKLTDHCYGRSTCSLAHGVAAMINPNEGADAAQKSLPPLQKTLSADLGRWNVSQGHDGDATASGD